MARFPAVYEERFYALLSENSSIFDDASAEAAGPSEVDSVALVNVRLRQAAFSEGVRERFGGRCALSGLGENFSVAAHIVDYAKCENAREKDDPDNGLFLAGHLHLAFDGHLFGIRPDGTVVWSRRADTSDRDRLGQLQRRIHVSSGSRPYLERRWETFQAIEGVSDSAVPSVDLQAVTGG